MFNRNEVRALTGDSSLTLVLPIKIAIQLGVENRDLLKYHVDGDRLIVEKIVDKEYYSTSNGQTTAMERKNKHECSSNARRDIKG
jgi:antitoxin component of MazEF toxin-antitoxin module